MTDVLSGMVTCEIPGKPVPCPRPRVGRKGTYYPEGYEAWRKDATRLLRDACVTQNGGRLMEGPVEVQVAFYGAHGSADLDNLIKALLDAAQGQVFANDRQVWRMCASKVASKVRTIEVRFTETTGGLR